jgi:PAS domain S-box-containing protein
MFGYKAEEVVGRSITILMPPERLDESSHILRRIRREENVEHFETVRRRKDGSNIIVSLTVSPIRNAEGYVVGASKIVRDITDRKRIEETIHQNQAMLTLAMQSSPHGSMGTRPGDEYRFVERGASKRSLGSRREVSAAPKRISSKCCMRTIGKRME